MLPRAPFEGCAAMGYLEAMAVFEVTGRAPSSIATRTCRLGGPLSDNGLSMRFSDVTGCYKDWCEVIRAEFRAWSCAHRGAQERAEQKCRLRGTPVLRIQESAKVGSLRYQWRPR